MIKGLGNTAREGRLKRWSHLILRRSLRLDFMIAFKYSNVRKQTVIHISVKERTTLLSEKAFCTLIRL